jgi:hypothetical protein
VPTRQDFINLDIAMGGTGENRPNTTYQMQWYIGTGTNQWGGFFANWCGGNGQVPQNTGSGRYWSIDEGIDNYGHLGNALTFENVSNGWINPQHSTSTIVSKPDGFTLRCVRDTAIGCNGNTPGWGNSLGTVSFATDNVWRVGSQIWSDAVQATYCSHKEIYDGGVFGNANSDCRSNPGYKGDFFSGCAVTRFARQLCRAPWRVPTAADFVTLMDNLGYYSTPYFSIWGGAHGGGYSSANGAIYQQNNAYYWTLNENRWFMIEPDYVTGPMQTGVGRNMGATLRCVRDTVIPPPAGCNGNTPGWDTSLGTVSFATPQTWTVENQVWSDAVQATNCNKTTYNGGSSGSFNSDCRSNPGQKGDLFSGCAVTRFQNQLCRTPWRVPTVQDFVNLDIALGGTGIFQQNLTHLNKYLNSWGGTYGGFCHENGDRSSPGSVATYWSQSEFNADSMFTLWLFTPFLINPEHGFHKAYGASLRCVRNE